MLLHTPHEESVMEEQLKKNVLVDIVICHSFDNDKYAEMSFITGQCENLDEALACLLHLGGDHATYESKVLSNGMCII